MPNRHPTTQTVTIPDLENHLSDFISEVQQKRSRVLVEKAGIPAAAIVSVDDLEVLHRRDKEWEELAQVIARAREAFKDVPPEEIEEEVDRIIARNRAADRAALEALTATG